MKKHLILILALVFAGLTTTPAEEAKGAVNMQGVNVSQVLDIYSRLAEKDLIIEPGATNQVRHLSLQISSATKSETIKLIEQALREQANVVITPLDAKRAAVKLVKK